jgi:hypothetical protein
MSHKLFLVEIDESNQLNIKAIIYQKTKFNKNVEEKRLKIEFTDAKSHISDINSYFDIKNDEMYENNSKKTIIVILNEQNVLVRGYIVTPDNVHDQQNKITLSEFNLIVTDSTIEAFDSQDSLLTKLIPPHPSNLLQPVSGVEIQRDKVFESADERENIKKIERQLIEYAKKFGGNYSEINSDPESEEYCNQFIDLYCFVVNKILMNTLFYKLTSLDVGVLKEFLLNKATIYFGNKADKILNAVKKQEFIEALKNFLYIDASIFKTSQNESQHKEVRFTRKQILGYTFSHFTKNPNNTKWEELLILDEFVKSKKNYIAFTNDKSTNDISNISDKLILYINDFVKAMKTSYKINFDWHGWKKDYYRLLFNLIQNHFRSFKDIFWFLDILKSNENVLEFNKQLNVEIQKHIDESIITFLKLRNDEESTASYEKRYNRRFKISINLEDNLDLIPPNKLVLEYNGDNFAFYKKVEKLNKQTVIMPSDQMVKYIPSSKEKFGRPFEEILDVNNYDNKYMFGEFSYIFPPHMSNKDIADRMKVIEEKLTGDERKPVFILGYGASGAGKTSSLIYYNNGKGDNKEGILIHLCNKLGSRYPTVKVKCKEFYFNSGSTDLSNPTIVNTPKDVKEYIEFVWNSEKNKYLLKVEYTHKINHVYRSNESFKHNGEETQILSEIQNEKNFDTTQSISDVLIYLIDTDRFVKATTNNPKSSRSHTLVFVEFFGENNKKANIIVGDFAGVENKFDCGNDNVLKEFLSRREAKKIGQIG